MKEASAMNTTELLEAMAKQENRYLQKLKEMEKIMRGLYQAIYL